MLGELPTSEPEPYNNAWALDPAVNNWHRMTHAARLARFADRPYVAMSVDTIFPNVSFLDRQPLAIALAHSDFPTECQPVEEMGDPTGQSGNWGSKLGKRVSGPLPNQGFAQAIARTAVRTLVGGLQARLPIARKFVGPHIRFMAA
ncbi:hypothetical protein [Paracraurococcus lichenis]|uniref:Uncharacterized protein n=1 Tax=Paracraurococcus lichenis TaxID=3064888 RepID=A0ABT9EC49_9PROT|nr:hypothetical protein [Paracraurococcus sp. LOR1-02]MDO9713712.1 hypothetical protein [Paracraurococcus sp. LOR1-02]